MRPKRPPCWRGWTTRRALAHRPLDDERLRWVEYRPDPHRAPASPISAATRARPRTGYSPPQAVLSLRSREGRTGARYAALRSYRRSHSASGVERAECSNRRRSSCGGSLSGSKVNHLGVFGLCGDGIPIALWQRKQEATSARTIGLLRGRTAKLGTKQRICSAAGNAATRSSTSSTCSLVQGPMTSRGYGTPLTPVPVRVKIDSDDVDLPHRLRVGEHWHPAIVSKMIWAGPAVDGPINEAAQLVTPTATLPPSVVPADRRRRGARRMIARPLPTVGPEVTGDGRRRRA
jgi:hypothetical protein